jgi:hypothetical protein
MSNAKSRRSRSRLMIRTFYHSFFQILFFAGFPTFLDDFLVIVPRRTFVHLHFNLLIQDPVFNPLSPEKHTRALVTRHFISSSNSILSLWANVEHRLHGTRMRSTRSNSLPSTHTLNLNNHISPCRPTSDALFTTKQLTSPPTLSSNENIFKSSLTQSPSRDCIDRQEEEKKTTRKKISKQKRINRPFIRLSPEQSVNPSLHRSTQSIQPTPPNPNT